MAIADKVVDASALGALAFGEAESAMVLTELSESRLLSPRLLPYEIASIARKKIKSHPDARRAIEVSLAEALAMPIALVDVNYFDVVRLSSQSNLSTYDASYLWLAVRLDVPIVTLDRRLMTAAGRLSAF
ncbi:MAG: PIN domain-containing protein [Dehalococcoidia bacterium]|nr:PIN domain-containing protein [Dehalococcoidia bacterium]